MTEIKTVTKRDQTAETFDGDKIVRAVMNAMESLGENHVDAVAAERIKWRVIKKLKKWNTSTPHVDQIHTLVEHSLMDAKMYDVAREYITYRDAHKPDIFRKRTNIKPYDYPQLMGYVDAINHSYWLHTEFNFTPDVQDIKVNFDEKERTAAIRSMLAISQIESTVKKFWGRIDDKLPKPEISSVGATFADSEVRHERAYSHLIEILGLNDEFESILEVPCIQKRVKYLEKVNSNMRSSDPREFFEAVILFSMFVENVSLFSQFLIILSFNKYNNKLKGISNAIEATSKEENIHAKFGFEIVNIIHEENPDWFDEALVARIQEMTREAFEAEKEIVEWIYEKGDLDAVPKNYVIEFVKQRLNESLEAINVKPLFNVDPEAMKELSWFDDEIVVTKNNDFFNKRGTTYTKRQQAITSTDLF